MDAVSPGVTRIPVQTADCFLLALDDFMRRTGQGRHVSQSVLELDRRRIWKAPRRLLRTAQEVSHPRRRG